jgi:ribosomal protein S24E
VIILELTITSKTEEPLLSRTMLKANVSFEKSTPSYTELTALIASKAKADEKLVAIRHVYTSFGNKNAEITAYVYKDEAKKSFIEPKVKEKKDAKAKEAEKK